LTSAAPAKKPRRANSPETLMSDLKLQTLIEQAFEDRAAINARTNGDPGSRPSYRARLEAFVAAWADAALQRHARHVGFDVGDFDAIVGLARTLRHIRHIAPAALADKSRHDPHRGRVGMERAMRPGVRIGLGLGRGSLRRLLTLRRRNAGIVGRLRRQAQLGLEFGDPSRQRRHLTHQRGDQRVLLRVREA
jgi:hypothetical protein